MGPCPLILLPWGLLEPHYSEEEMEILRCVPDLFGKIRTETRVEGMGDVVAELPQGRGSSGTHSHLQVEPCCHPI